MKCKCGCGRKTGGGNSFINGHNRRLKKDEILEADRIKRCRKWINENGLMDLLLDGGYPMTMQEIANHFGVSQQRIEQNLLSGIDKLVFDSGIDIKELLSDERTSDGQHEGSPNHVMTHMRQDFGNGVYNLKWGGGV